ncbi:MAG: HAD-IC family P-type ATPase, partial [Clostridia bacterium]
DGVNDAPSLKKASIGVGMGITGTDVTKEAADIIVTDDSFATIVIAVEEGRKIFKNIQKTINFLFASNFAEVMSLLLALIIFPELTFLLPLQILFVNLITDSLPAMALGHETAEKNIMAKPPRKSTDNLFSKGVGLSIFLQGFFQTLIVVSVFAIGNHFAGNAAASTMAFFTLNLIQVFFIFSVRTNNSIFKSNLFANKWLAISILAIIIILGLFAFTGLGALIGLVSLNYKMWLTVLGCSFLILPINEIYKAVYKKIKTNKANKNKIK